MDFNFRDIDGDRFIGHVEQSHDFLNVLKFFNEERLPITIVTYKEHEEDDVYEDYIVEDFFLTLLNDGDYKYNASITVRVRKDEDY